MKYIIILALLSSAWLLWEISNAPMMDEDGNIIDDEK